jgi:hypothetical protein
MTTFGLSMSELRLLWAFFGGEETPEAPFGGSCVFDGAREAGL